MTRAGEHEAVRQVDKQLADFLTKWNQLVPGQRDSYLKGSAFNYDQMQNEDCLAEEVKEIYVGVRKGKRSASHRVLLILLDDLREIRFLLLVRKPSNRREQNKRGIEAAFMAARIRENLAKERTGEQ